MLNSLKNKNYILFILMSIVGIFWSILQIIDILEAHEILPEKTFVFTFWILIIIFFIIIIIITLVHAFRPAYIDEQIKYIKKANETIYMSIHSLNGEEKNIKYKKLDESLQIAKNNKKDVKILAPGGIERAHGAWQMCKNRHLTMKFAEQLEDQDLRYTLIDNDIVIISYQKISSKGLSRKFATIHSERLNKTLKKYFEDMWNEKDSKDFSDYLKNILDDLKITKEPASIKRASKKLEILEDDLKEFLDEFD